MIGAGSAHINYGNVLGTAYLSKTRRIAIEPETGYMTIEVLTDGIWQPGSLETGANSLWVGHTVGVAGLGHHLATESNDGHLHFHVHSEYDGELTTDDAAVVYADYYAAYIPVQPDDSKEWTGQIFDYVHHTTSHALLKNLFIKIGATVPTDTIRLQVWKGTDDTGTVTFDQKYPVSNFSANTEATLELSGMLEFMTDEDYLFRYSSGEDFSLKVDTTQVMPALAIGFSRVREDRLLQTAPWVDGGTYTKDESWFIDSRKIYVCNTDGVQNGTFAENADKWDALLSVEADPVFSAWESAFTAGSIVFADATGLTENNSELFWDNANKRLGIGLADPVRLLHMQDRNATFRIDRDANSPAVMMHRFPSGDFTTPWKGFIFGVNADGPDDGSFFISDFHQNVSGGGDQRLAIDTDGKITIPGALDIGGIISGDGSGLTDLVEYDPIFTASPSAGIVAQDILNWDEAYGWGDHAQAGYLTEETDPVFTAWDKSSGISITESQISDLSHTPAFDGDIPEIYNSLGLFKIQPDAQGDVELFGDTDVSNAENSKIFKVWRRAAEGNDYIRFYVSSGRVCYIHSSNKLTLQAQNPFTINSVTDDIIFKVGDNAGSRKFYFRDSDGNNVMTLDSNGVLNLDANIGAKLNLTRGTVNKISNHFDAVYTDLRFEGEKDFNRIGTWIPKPFQIVTDSVDRIIIDRYGRVEIPSSLTVGDLEATDDILAYNDIAARNFVSRGIYSFPDYSTQEEAGARNHSHGHTHTAIYNDDWYDTDSDGMASRDMHFSPDGLMMYIIGIAGGGIGDCSIWEYPLTTPWDLSTVGTPTIESIETYGSNQTGLYIGRDGRRLWTVCSSNDTIIEYSMSPWDISRLSWVQAKDISGQDTAPSSIFWSPQGNRVYVAGDSDNDIIAFSVTNEWDISGLSWFENFGTNIDAPTGLHFSSDGRRMYVMDGSAEDDIHEFHLSSPWMISSARLVNLFDVSAENSSPQGIFITSDNSKIFMVGTSTPDGVYGYDLGLEVKGKIISGTFKTENMPTSDPTDAGSFWNDGGTVKVSAG